MHHSCYHLCGPQPRPAQRIHNRTDRIISGQQPSLDSRYLQETSEERGWFLRGWERQYRRASRVVCSAVYIDGILRGERFDQHDMIVILTSYISMRNSEIIGNLDSLEALRAVLLARCTSSSSSLKSLTIHT